MALCGLSMSIVSRFFGSVLNGCDGMLRCPCLVARTDSVVLSSMHDFSVVTTSALLAMFFHVHAHIPLPLRRLKLHFLSSLAQLNQNSS